MKVFPTKLFALLPQHDKFLVKERLHDPTVGFTRAKLVLKSCSTAVKLDIRYVYSPMCSLGQEISLNMMILQGMSIKCMECLLFYYSICSYISYIIATYYFVIIIVMTPQINRYILVTMMMRTMRVMMMMSSPHTIDRTAVVLVTFSIQ